MEISEIKKCLGHNFIGADELSLIKNSFSVQIPTVLPPIPFDESTIVANRDTHLLLLCLSKFSDGTDITIKAMKERISMLDGAPCFYNQDWYLNEEFIKKTLKTKWLFISKKLLDDSRAMTIDKVLSKYKLYSAVELTFAFFANYFINNGEKLWNNDYVWCSDVDDKGDQIYVGRYTDASGLNKDGFEIHRHLRIKKNYGVI